jgi:hypothetical protein
MNLTRFSLSRTFDHFYKSPSRAYRVLVGIPVYSLKGFLVFLNHALLDLYLDCRDLWRGPERPVMPIRYGDKL